MDKEASYSRMIDFLKSSVVEDPETEIDAATPLVSSGLVDSFALIDILVELERITGLKIAAGRVAPDNLDSIEEMFATADRVGVPRR